MLVVGIIFSIGLLGVIVYFAVSPKSSKILRLAAIIALGLICLSLIVSGIFIIKGPAEDEGIIPLPVFQDSSPEAKSNFRVTDIIIISAILVVLSLVIAKALKDQKKTQLQTLKPKASLGLSDDDLGQRATAVNNDEDSFDLDDLDIK